MLHNAVWGGRASDLTGKKRYEGLRFTLLTLPGGGGWVGVKFPGKKALRNTLMASKRSYTVHIIVCNTHNHCINIMPNLERN